MTGILGGIRVVDFGRHIAGPFCGMLLADLGAEVIRVEKQPGADDRYVTPVTASGEGSLYLLLNRNKLSLTLDLQHPRGREVASRLISTADVVIANMPPATLAAAGLDYESLKAIKSDIILATSSTFGEGGPYSHRVGFDGIAQAVSGAMFMGGLPGNPNRSYVPWVDFGTASLVAFGILAALIERGRSGKGQKVEGALLFTALTFNSSVLLEQAVKAPNRVPSGSRSQFSGPSDFFITKDGMVVVQVVGQSLFERWTKLVGEPSWLTDPRFTDDASRGANGEVLSKRMQAWCAERTNAEVMAELDLARIPCGPVLSPAQTLVDSHVQATGFLREIDYPGLPQMAPLASTPIALSETPGTIRTRAPTLGEHTDQVLTSIGYAPADVESLRTCGAI
jgi:crotonobetainyl-CoA:carnitine CoA-transferase CaiB-like acyl-CoA transferase